MFWQRLGSGIILLIIAITTVFLGGNILLLTTLLISIVGMYELNKVANVEKRLPGLLSYLACMIYYIMLHFELNSYYIIFFIFYLMLLMVLFVAEFPKLEFEQILIPFFSLFYIAIMLSYIYQSRMLSDGALVVWLIFIGAWGSDTCAYCTGMLFGKHKLSPKISPKKSIEGSIGGIIGAALLGFIFAYVFKGKIVGLKHPQIGFASIGAVSSIISQLGDFAASGIKRKYDVKDFGNLIPGHGGILDRFDSIIFTAPIVYFLAKIF